MVGSIKSTLGLRTAGTPELLDTKYYFPECAKCAHWDELEELKIEPL